MNNLVLAVLLFLAMTSVMFGLVQSVLPTVPEPVLIVIAVLYVIVAPLPWILIAVGVLSCFYAVRQIREEHRNR